MERRTTITATAVAALAGFAGVANAAVTPIDATGWNHDMVINGAGPYDVSVTGTMDGGFGQAENWTWVEAGTYTNPDGNLEAYQGLVAGTHSSLTGNGTFAFQDFSSLNTLGLDGGITSGTLTLTTPAAYQTIALYGASGFGGKNYSVVLGFDDSSTSEYTPESGSGIGTDWYNTNADKALVVGGRASNKSEEGYTRLFYGQNDVISINETFLELTAADQAKTLTSVTVNLLGDGTGGGFDRMAVFALSGEASVVPEPAALSLLALGGLVIGRRRRQA